MSVFEATAAEVATEFEARQLTDEIRHHVQRAWGTVVTAYQKRVARRARTLADDLADLFPDGWLR